MCEYLFTKMVKTTGIIGKFEEIKIRKKAEIPYKAETFLSLFTS